MDVEAIFNRLMDAGVSVWLDSDSKLRIDKGAPDEIKQLVRENRQSVMDVKRAIAMMNDRGIRISRLPVGHLALAYPLGTDLDEIRWAVKVLRLESLPLVISDEGLRRMTWHQWKLRRHVCTEASRQVASREAQSETQPKLQFGRKTA